MVNQDKLFPENPLLIIDDEPSWLKSMALSLKAFANITNIVFCQDSREAEKMLAQKRYSLVLLDLTMPYLSGELLLKDISEKHPDLPVIVVSGMNQIETAINCIKSGAFDFFVKTDDRQRIINGILNALKQSEQRQENQRLAESLLFDAVPDHAAFSGIITINEKMQRILAYLSAVSSSREPLLIQGESGTGKELIARALHQFGYADRPLVAVNVAGLDDMVFSDTLFGHVKGAYTSAEGLRKGMVEEAGDGVLFLDEIGDLSAASQVKLLRLLQEGEYYPLGSDKPKKCRARIVVATNLDLQHKEAEGAFRRDLLFRLSTHRIELLPLRERKEDIPYLLDFFLNEAASAAGKKTPTYPPELLTLLNAYHFPGNIREMKAMVHDAVSVHAKGVLSLERFKEAIAVSGSALSEEALTVPLSQLHIKFPERLPTIKDMTRLLIAEALERTGGNQSQAAQLLGITHQALNQRLKKLS